MTIWFDDHKGRWICMVMIEKRVTSGDQDKRPEIPFSPVKRREMSSVRTSRCRFLLFEVVPTRGIGIALVVSADGRNLGAHLRIGHS